MWVGSSAAQDGREVIQALSHGQHEVALRLRKELLAGSPRNHALLTLRGIALTRIGRTEEALASYRSALQAAPDYLAALRSAAEIEFRQLDPEAQDRLERVISVRYENPTAHAMLGVLAFERQDCPTAVRHFTKPRPA